MYQVSILLDKASCPGRWYYPNFVCFFGYQLSSTGCCVVSPKLVTMYQAPLVLQPYLGVHAEKSASKAGDSGNSLAIT